MTVYFGGGPLKPTEPSPYCGRLDTHDGHDWTRTRSVDRPAASYHCPGAPLVEGGNPVNACDECGLGVRDEDLAPSCGAHRLHDTCAAWFFGCQECDQYRREVTC